MSESKKKSNILSLPIKRSENEQNSQQQRPVVWKRGNYIASLIMIATLAISGALTMQIFGYWKQANALDAQIATAKEQATTIQTQHDALSQQVQLLQQDDYVAKLARSEYYLSKNGEIIFNTPKTTDAEK